LEALIFNKLLASVNNIIKPILIPDSHVPGLEPPVWSDEGIS